MVGGTSLPIAAVDHLNKFGAGQTFDNADDARASLAIDEQNQDDVL